MDYQTKGLSDYQTNGLGWQLGSDIACLSDALLSVTRFVVGTFTIISKIQKMTPTDVVCVSLISHATF